MVSLYASFPYEYFAVYETMCCYPKMICSFDIKINISYNYILYHISESNLYKDNQHQDKQASKDMDKQAKGYISIKLYKEALFCFPQMLCSFDIIILYLIIILNTIFPDQICYYLHVHIQLTFIFLLLTF